MESDRKPSQSPDKRVTQGDMPAFPLEKVRPIAQAIWDQFAGVGAAPHEIANVLGISPTSSGWRMMTGAAIAYGITEGGYNSKEIRLMPLGRKMVAPEDEGESEAAVIEAVKKPTILQRFFERYDKKKLPSDEIGANVLVSFGLPKERSAQAFATIKQNGEYAQLIVDTKAGPFVVNSPRLDQPTRRGAGAIRPAFDEEQIVDVFPDDEPPMPLPPPPSPSAVPVSNKVYISHGTDRNVVEQLEKIIKVAKYEPIASVRRETTAKPVSDKVFDDMRDCFAGIIHVGSEGILKDEGGNEVRRINENVLIEIGAAIAFYKRNVILLVEKSLALPSNLQGLYRCEYEGKELTAAALFKVLDGISMFTNTTA